MATGRYVVIRTFRARTRERVKDVTTRQPNV